MTALIPLIPDDFEFSPVSVRNTVANKGGAYAGVSRAGCTVNEPYQSSETCRLCCGLESPRLGPISQSGHPQAPYRLQPYQRVRPTEPDFELGIDEGRGFVKKDGVRTVKGAEQ